MLQFIIYSALGIASNGIVGILMLGMGATPRTIGLFVLCNLLVQTIMYQPLKPISDRIADRIRAARKDKRQ